MSAILVLIALVEAALFSCGLVLGAHLQDLIHEQDRRRWLAKNRALTEQVRVLADQAAASEEDMRWLSKEQAGLVVLDHEDQQAS